MWPLQHVKIIDLDDEFIIRGRANGYFECEIAQSFFQCPQRDIHRPHWWLYAGNGHDVEYRCEARRRNNEGASVLFDRGRDFVGRQADTSRAAFKAFVFLGSE